MMCVFMDSGRGVALPNSVLPKGKKLLRIRPRGFCAGVVRAVDIVQLAVEAYGPPVYVHHEIVHNRYVVEQLRRRGAIFVESVEDVPIGAVLIFSAHGVPPTVREEAHLRKLRVIDATCPLVTKVHLEALRFAREVQLMLVVGSPNSSNSNRLVEVAQRCGVKARLIDDASAISADWFEGIESVGLTAGSSAPEVLVEQVSERLAQYGFTDQSDLDLIREDVRFTLPPELAVIAPAAKSN